MRKDGRERSHNFVRGRENASCVIDIAKFSVEERIAILSAATELPVSVRAACLFFPSSPSFFDAKKMTARLAAAIRYVMYLYSTMTMARRIKVKNTTTTRTYAGITRPLVRSGHSL